MFLLVSGDVFTQATFTLNWLLNNYICSGPVTWFKNTSRSEDMQWQSHQPINQSAVLHWTFPGTGDKLPPQRWEVTLLPGRRKGLALGAIGRALLLQLLDLRHTETIFNCAAALGDNVYATKLWCKAVLKSLQRLSLASYVSIKNCIKCFFFYYVTPF